jgi:hypothetical protein
MPALMAVAIDPGPHVVYLGLLSVDQRKRLKAELDAQGWTPKGAPAAGFGGASTSQRVSPGWLIAGVPFLVITVLASIAYWRRRRSP